MVERHAGPESRIAAERRTDVHGNQQVPLATPHAVVGHGIDHAAIDEHHPVAVDRTEYRRDRDRGPDGIVEPAPVEHHFAARHQIGRNGRKRHRHLLDPHVGDQLLHGPHHAVPLHQPLGAEGEINQAEHLVAVQRTHPLLERLEMTRGIHAPDQRTHRGARHGAHLETLTLQLLDGADMRDAPRTAAAQHKRDAPFLLHKSFL